MKELAIDTLNKTKVIISRDRKNRPMDNVLDESCNSRDEYDETSTKYSKKIDVSARRAC